MDRFPFAKDFFPFGTYLRRTVDNFALLQYHTIRKDKNTAQLVVLCAGDSRPVTCPPRVVPSLRI